MLEDDLLDYQKRPSDSKYSKWAFRAFLIVLALGIIQVLAPIFLGFSTMINSNVALFFTFTNIAFRAVSFFGIVTTVLCIVKKEPINIIKIVAIIGNTLILVIFIYYLYLAFFYTPF